MTVIIPRWWMAAPAIAAAAAPLSAQVFSSQEQALRTVFGAEAEIGAATWQLAPEERQALEASSGLRFRESAYRIHKARRKGQVAGYALVMDEIGKSEPITFLVAVSPEFRVQDVVILVFRESRGWEVREPRFTRQFRGKRSSDAFRVNQDILNYNGATLSSKAVARGTKRALLLVEHFYKAGAKGAATRERVVLGPYVAGRAAAAAGGMQRQAHYRMGTVCEVRVRGGEAEAGAAFAAAFDELSRLETVFSAYRADSELSEVNASAARGPVRVSRDFWLLLKAAVRGWRKSEGAFDITAGPLARVWGFRTGARRVPAAAELREALELVGSEKLRLDRRERTVQFARAGMELDFGGLTKGYAAGRIAAQLRRLGITEAMVNLGGSSLASLAAGRAGERGEPAWLVGVADPGQPSLPGAWLEMGDGMMLSTSGTYEQAAMVEGRAVTHVFDPRTGMPVAVARSATVLGPSGTESEMWAKKLLLDAGERKIPRHIDWLVLERGKGPRFRLNAQRAALWEHTG